MTPLERFVAAALARDVPKSVVDAAAALGGEGAVAVLFYGSVLRTGALADVLDFYVLTDGGGHGAARLWPDVAYRELTVGDTAIRAKVATMPLTVFAAAARGETRDSTIWTRFCQPAALAWTRDPATRRGVIDAVGAAVRTASGFAMLHGPAAGEPAAYWRALFAATYDLELRFEARGRGDTIVAAAADHYAAALPLGWTDDGLPFDAVGPVLRPAPTSAWRRAKARAWRRLRRTGKALNAARLVKAAFTFEGATAYALYKIARHTGVALPLTPWRERHPLLAAPGVLWRVWRARPAR